MKRFVVGFVAVACGVALSAFGQNKVVFDNQSGDPALVKLIGPTKTEVQVPNGGKTVVDATAGKYTIKVRYGSLGNYRYSKGQEFDVTETATARSETTITLHKVVAGNYDARPISEAEFGTAEGAIAVSGKSEVIVEGKAGQGDGVLVAATAYLADAIRCGPPMGLISEVTTNDGQLVIVRATITVSGLVLLNDFALTDSDGNAGKLLGIDGEMEEEQVSAPESSIRGYWETGLISLPPAIKPPQSLVLAYRIKHGCKLPLTMRFRGEKSQVTLVSHREWLTEYIKSPRPEVRLAAAKSLGRKSESGPSVIRALEAALETEKDTAVREAIQTAIRASKGK